ncbi:hypothetical protein DER44DRAFT_853623 [Fusarium oxysporum]|nr:hypothetical protein DER44DRAFT_853623 [Fusarium oxysporum]
MRRVIPSATGLPLERGSCALGLKQSAQKIMLISILIDPFSKPLIASYREHYYAIIPTLSREMSYIDAHTNSLLYMEGVTMLDGCTPDEPIGNGLTVYGPVVPSHPRWELSESMNSPAFLGAFQDEVGITMLSRQTYLPQDQFVFYGDFSWRDRWVDTYSTVKNQTLPPERLLTVADEPPSNLTPSLQLSQESLKTPDRKSKTQLSQRVAPKSARRNARGNNNTDDQRRKGCLADENGINISGGATNHKHAKHKQAQERNRIAANKCRMRKKDDLAKLQSDEQAMEERHRTLSSSVDDLKEEVLYLKMQLLQHTSCNCTLIHHYISEEAQQYVHALETR